MNFRTVCLLVCVAAAVWGCARVRVEAPKEAIKVDISMRLDIYQHVEKDINDIENLVSGSRNAGQSSLLDGLFQAAYAQETLSPEVEQAALRRRDRKQALSAAQARQALGENRLGLVEARPGADAAAQALAAEENSDRMLIYRAVAAKNGTSVEEVQKLYARRLQSDAPAGTPIETADAGGPSQWKTK